MGLLAFPLFALVFAPFVITYIASEGPENTPYWGLAFIVEVAWLVFLLVTVNLVAFIVKAVKKDKEPAQGVAVSDERHTGALVEVLQALEKAGDRGVPSRRLAHAAAAWLLERGYMRKESAACMRRRLASRRSAAGKGRRARGCSEHAK